MGEGVWISQCWGGPVRRRGGEPCWAEGGPPGPWPRPRSWHAGGRHCAGDSPCFLRPSVFAQSRDIAPISALYCQCGLPDRSKGSRGNLSPPASHVARSDVPPTRPSCPPPPHHLHPLTVDSGRRASSGQRRACPVQSARAWRSSPSTEITSGPEPGPTSAARQTQPRASGRVAGHLAPASCRG